MKTHAYIRCYRGYWSDGGMCRIRICQEDSYDPEDLTACAISGSSLNVPSPPTVGYRVRRPYGQKFSLPCNENFCLLWACFLWVPLDLEDLPRDKGS